MKKLLVLATCTTLLWQAAVFAIPAKTHKVRRGQNFQWIAGQHKVSWEAMLLVNEGFLRTKYTEVCGDLSRNFRHRRNDRGTHRGGLYYCNDRFVRPYGNTLRPGWELVIPTNTAPTNIGQAIAEIRGNKVALVIDDTGSMNDDRQRVSEFYLAAINQYGKRLSGVWLYADGRVRKYEAGGVRFLTEGGRENTFGALSEAAKVRPDAIVLVTDEPGDDWNWGEVRSLPPVVAHCLGDLGDGYRSCQSNLERLARETRGRYITGIR
jgi:hypothetical protein